ncbi:hypothetical protein [Jiella pelagia]|uniref:Phage DNA packaging protein, Nu1 subunit of terminase n=1 Tax=Jiella pelagia TaxID=2986949 RepID=A0ABY7C5D6_9HYPH|nr:hypothetical protein [Jiella pelagia]WAP69050.1 hypothetical protein OH818_01560 [Jiella pelagia]
MVAEAAGRLGISRQALHALIKNGKITEGVRRGADGRVRGVVFALMEPQYLANIGTAINRLTPHPGIEKARSRKNTDKLGDLDSIPDYNESRAKKAAWEAEEAQIDVEQKLGTLVKADEVNSEAFKMARQVRDKLMNLPDRLAPELAAETNPGKVFRKLQDELNAALAALASDAG